MLRVRAHVYAGAEEAGGTETMSEFAIEKLTPLCPQCGSALDEMPRRHLSTAPIETRCTSCETWTGFAVFYRRQTDPPA